jgi:hypothetical protein
LSERFRTTLGMSFARRSARRVNTRRILQTTKLRGSTHEAQFEFLPIRENWLHLALVAWRSHTDFACDLPAARLHLIRAFTAG